MGGYCTWENAGEENPNNTLPDGCNNNLLSKAIVHLHSTRNLSLQLYWLLKQKLWSELTLELWNARNSEVLHKRWARDQNLLHLFCLRAHSLPSDQSIRWQTRGTWSILDFTHCTLTLASLSKLMTADSTLLTLFSVHHGLQILRKVQKQKKQHLFFPAGKLKVEGMWPYCTHFQVHKQV